eukprot:TRINITY_DN7034_c0_g1_i3.p1 TRINITY_DN7034_c0_g1~~TRINITY_DN7034_c0_g1_i3.p1  ORF type:complete len:265 (+),score=22.73 TRINITY_DN7034_c0_g1_i3:579-1373(+)
MAKQYFGTDESRSEYEKQIYHQISVDVPRTNPSVTLFQDKTCQSIFTRILYLWAIRHPASGYVQGINDLVTPFFTVFLQPYSEIPWLAMDNLLSIPEEALQDIEADSYWCLSKFIDGIQDNYTFAQPGIQRMLYKLKEVVQKIDAPLHNHLTDEKTEYIQFAFRWMNCLLMREMPLHVVIRLLDTYLSEGDSFTTMHVYTCAAFLVKWSAEVQQRDFMDIMTFIQNLPTTEWTCEDVEPLLSQAYIWKTLYNDSGHLKSNKPKS